MHAIAPTAVGAPHDASNEIAINWNAPIAYLSAAIDAEYAARRALTP